MCSPGALSVLVKGRGGMVSAVPKTQKLRCRKERVVLQGKIFPKMLCLDGQNEHLIRSILFLKKLQAPHSPSPCQKIPKITKDIFQKLYLFLLVSRDCELPFVNESFILFSLKYCSISHPFLSIPSVISLS